MRTTHRGATIGVGLMAAVVLCLGLSPIAGAEPRDGRSAAAPLLKSLDMQYVKQVTKHLGTIGANEDGFRVTGTPQDEETANYLADQMDAIGLEDVSVEPLTTDGWLFSGGSVTAKGGGIDRTFRVSSLGGVPGTPAGGVSGRIVPVGYGTAPSTKVWTSRARSRSRGGTTTTSASGRTTSPTRRARTARTPSSSRRRLATAGTRREVDVRSAGTTVSAAPPSAPRWS